MGIEKFFSSVERNPITNTGSKFVEKLQHQVRIQNLLVDFNSIVHVVSAQTLDDLNYLIYHLIKNSIKQNIVISPKMKGIIDTYKLKIVGDTIHQSSDTVWSLESITETITLISHRINKIILSRVEEYVLDMLLTNFIEPQELKFLFIAIDGVPHMGKVIEQRKRRYLGSVVSLLKKKIFDKYNDKIKLDKVKYLFETNKLSWSKINISPGTMFMDQITKLFESNEFKQRVSVICPNLSKYICSSANVFGEGEKKITDYVYAHDLPGTLGIYSPDSDMSLLCLIMSNRVKNHILILRHNQQENNYDIIDINKLSDNIFSYVSNAGMASGFSKINQASVIDDIVFILTVCGNDFVPKIESINIKNDFDKIINKYILLIKDKHEYVINYDDKLKKKVLNQKVLTRLLGILQEDEETDLRYIYMANNYHNYNRLQKVFNITGNANAKFLDVYDKFLIKLSDMNAQISKSSQINIDKYVGDNEFINTLMQVTRFDPSLIKTKSDNPRVFISNYIKQYEHSKNFKFVNGRLQPYSRSIKNFQYEGKLKDYVERLDPALPITDYDREIFKLDNVLDEYVEKFNYKPLSLGLVYVDNEFNLKYGDVKKEIAQYYKDFFNNDPNAISTYIEGLVWVFEYYFNSLTTPKADMWYYSFTHSPLLQDIYKFMKEQPSDYIEKLQHGNNVYLVDFENFFNPIEHMMFVSPVELYPDIIPVEYRPIAKSNDLYIDINKLVNTNNIIDCRGIVFLSKCHVNALDMGHRVRETYGKILVFIIKLRKIKNFNI